MKKGITHPPVVWRGKTYYCEWCKKPLDPPRIIVGKPTVFCNQKHYEAWEKDFEKKRADVLVLFERR